MQGTTWFVDSSQEEDSWQGEALNNTLVLRSVVSSTLNGVVCPDTTEVMEVYVHPSCCFGIARSVDLQWR